MCLQSELEASRRKIADSSGGTSSAPLRRSVIEIARKLDLRGEIADVGAGKGDLIPLLEGVNRFSAITGFDLMARPSDLPSSVEWCEADLNQPLPCAPESFDVVVSLGVIEYLENPFAFARELHRVLRPGGTAIVTTPNNESWRALTSLVIQGHFAAFSPLGSNLNLTALVRSDLNKALRAAGFRSVNFTWTGKGMIPKLPLSWQAVSGGLLRGMRYSDDLVVTCRKA